jgi:TonB-linked SusC/RagA family outer membrane protein
MLSYLGRLAYSYDDKYLLTATIRRDGTSKVRKETRWGNFPSVSVAWRISNEQFMESSRNWLDDLKLRVSYGELGGMNIDPWEYVALINTNSMAPFGPSQTGQPGGLQVSLVNENLRWERQTQTNFGFDATMFRNRFTFSADYYISKAFDLLLGLPIPVTTGNSGGNPVVNAADMENRGFEFALGWRERSGDFNYYANASITTSKNLVTGLGYDGHYISNGTGRTEVGRSVGEFYLIQADGFFKTDEEAANYTWTNPTTGAVRRIQPKAMAGDMKYIDYNNDGQITDGDRSYVGSPHSEVQFGLNTGVTWRNIDFQMNWFGDLGGMVYNDTRRFLGSGDGAESQKLHLENYWTPDNPDAEYPRLIADKTDNGRGSTFWLENGSYVKLKSLTLGYNLPKLWLGKVGVESCRLYFTGQNLLTFTKFKMADPEFRKDSITSKGFRGRNAFPNPLTLNVGVQLQF